MVLKTRKLLIPHNGKIEKNRKNDEPEYAPSTRNRLTHRLLAGRMREGRPYRCQHATTNIDMELAGNGGDFGVGGFRRTGRRPSSADFVVE